MNTISESEMHAQLAAMVARATPTPEAAAARCRALTNEQLIATLMGASPEDAPAERAELLRRLGPGSAATADTLSNEELLGDTIAHAQEAAVEAAFAGTHVVDNHDGNEPICRIERYFEKGDSSVGLQDAFGWQLAADQAGTEWERLSRAGEELGAVLDELRSIAPEPLRNASGRHLAHSLVEELAAARHRLEPS